MATRTRSRFSLSLVARMAAVSALLGLGTFAVIQSKPGTTVAESDGEEVPEDQVHEFHGKRFIGSFKSKNAPVKLLSNDETNDSNNIRLALNNEVKIPEKSQNTIGDSETQNSAGLPKQFLIPKQNDEPKVTSPPKIEKPNAAKFAISKPSTRLNIQDEKENEKPLIQPSGLPNLLTAKNKIEKPKPIVVDKIPDVTPKPNSLTMKNLTPSNPPNEIPKPKIKAFANSSPKFGNDTQTQDKPETPQKPRLDSSFALNERPKTTFDPNRNSTPKPFERTEKSFENTPRQNQLTPRRIVGSSIGDPNKQFSSNANGGGEIVAPTPKKPTFPEIPPREPARNIGNTFSNNLAITEKRADDENASERQPSASLIQRINQQPETTNNIRQFNPTNPSPEKTESISFNPRNNNLNRTDTSPRIASTATPGRRILEGVQTPSIALEKQAPREVQVGRPATFRMIVKNVGRVDAYDVQVVDRIPEGTRLQSAKPKPTSSSDDALVWNLGTMTPGEEQVILLELVPEQRGEIGSVARVSFQARAAVRTVSTKPQLRIQHVAPKKVLIGQDVVVKINVQNMGDGAATSVIIEELVPEQLYHPESRGRSLEYPVGTLAPGESREISLKLKANKAGLATNNVSVKGDGGLIAKDQLQFEVVAPKLLLDIKGPSRRFLERLAVYEMGIRNEGTAAATNVNMVAKLPRGLKFVETNNNGQYNPRTHSVYWSLIELPPGTQGVVKMKVLPIDTGSQKIEYESRADLNLQAKKELNVAVEQLAELFFDVDDTADPIEVGTDTTYHVRVVNQGSKEATNVRVQIRFPDSIRPVKGDGPSKFSIGQNNVVDFAAIPRLAPSADATFKVQAKGLREGVHRIQVLMSSDERKDPVSKEESTEVYNENR